MLFYVLSSKGGYPTASHCADNGQGEDLVIDGFDGEVSQPGGEAMPGISVLLFGGPKKLSRGQCPDNAKTQVSAPAGLTQLCHIKTDNRLASAGGQPLMGAQVTLAAGVKTFSELKKTFVI